MGGRGWGIGGRGEAGAVAQRSDSDGEGMLILADEMCWVLWLGVASVG